MIFSSNITPAGDTELREHLMDMLQENDDRAYSAGENGESFVTPWNAQDFIDLIHAREQALLAAIRAEMPEKQYYPKIFKKLNPEPPIGTQHFGYNTAVADVAAILTKYEEMK